MNAVGNESAYMPLRGESDSARDEILARPIDDLLLSTRAHNALTKAGIRTIGELSLLTDEQLLHLRNFGATSVSEVREKLRQVALPGHETLASRDGNGREPTPTPRQAARARRMAVAGAVLAVVRGHSGRAVMFSEIQAAVDHQLELPTSADEVREGLRLQLKACEELVKVARDVYAWAPDGRIPPPPHVAHMIERRWRGDTLDEIGVAHGVTRERIRQLLKKYGGPTSEQVRDRRVAILSAAERDRETAIATDVRRALRGCGPMTVAEVVEATGHDVDDVSRFWPRELSHLLLRPAGTNENRWSDEEVLDAIREAALYEFPLTTNAYSELLSQGQIKGASMPRIWQRYGSWTAACEAAGVVTGQAMRTNYQSRWTDDDLLQIVRRYLLDPSAPNSAHRFDEWKRAAVPDGPSFQTLRNRFGSWTELKRRALAQEDGAT